MTTSRVLRIRETGNPLEVVRLEEETVESLCAGELLVDVLFAPINPADINILQGRYGKRPELPFVPGMEGVGVVRDAGDAALRERFVGKRVLLPAEYGSWRERGVVKAAGVVEVPDTLHVELAAMLRVNPPTAWRMLHDFAELKTGNWLVQNAANSAVGRSVIQIAKHLGLRTINFVRRPELVAGLEDIGADVVLVESRDVAKTVGELTGGARVALGLNAVGGDSAIAVASCLSDDAAHVTYGAMSLQALKIPNAYLIFKNIRFCGFWLSRWNETASANAVQEMFNMLAGVAETSGLTLPVDSVFPLEDHRAALARAQEGMREGKVLFRCHGASD